MTPPPPHRGLAFDRLLAALLLAGALGIVVAWAVRSGRPTTPRSIPPTAPPSEAQLIQNALNDDVRPLLERYCYACHADGNDEGGVALDSYADLDAVQADRATWSSVVEMLDYRFMPPDDQPQPTQREIDAITGWAHRALAHHDCEGPVDPGRVTIRRLNRNEYNLTVRDLVGIDFQPAAGFPADDTGYGFDNIADVLSVSPLLMEKYLAAAEQIADRAIVTQPPVERTAERFDVVNMRATGGNNTRGRGRYMYTNATATQAHKIEHAGTYELRLRAWGKQAGPDPTQLRLTLNGKPLKTFDVKAIEGKTGTYTHRLRLRAGTQRFGLAFVNDYYRPKEKDPAQRDRNLYIESLTVDGPTDALPLEKHDAHKRIVFVEPDNGLDDRQAAKRVIARFARRAFRRPVTDAEVDRLLTMYDQARQAGDNHERGIKLAVTATLVSPHFVYLVERDPPTVEPGAVYTLDGHAIATRLSYFLWSSMPDDELFRLAERGELHQPDVLAAQAKRMLADDKAQALVRHFAGQWLELRSLDEVSPDPARYPAWSDELKHAMRREAELLFTHVMQNDRPITELVTADYTYVNPVLAAHYGVAMPDATESRTEDGFAFVQLLDAERGGVLTLGAVLTVTSNPTRTSPVKRGKWVLEQVLGTKSPPAPPDVPDLDESPQAEAGATLRERLAQHIADENCAVCHARMDPIGFAMEHYDAIGAWRDTDAGGPIDPTAEMPDGTPLDGAGSVKQMVLARQDQFVRGFVEKMLTYALGRGLRPADRCVVNHICDRAKSEGYRFGAVIEAIATSDPMLKRRAAEPAQTGDTS